MFPIKRIEQLYFDLNHYYSQVISFQDREKRYQDILIKFSKILSELDEVIEEMRKYNNNTNNQIVNLNK
jgi:hypothetical protein